MTKRKLINYERKENDGYEYHKITSYGPASMYGTNLTNEEYENRHLDHIISDYQEDGFEILTAECELIDDICIMNFVARRKA